MIRCHPKVRIKRFYHPAKDIYLKLYQLFNIMDDEDRLFRNNRTWQTWADLFPNIDIGGAQRFELRKIYKQKFGRHIYCMIAYDIAKEFWRCFINDMIDNNARFRTPFLFFELSIKGFPYTRIKNAKFNIRTMGKFYIPVLKQMRENNYYSMGIPYMCKLPKSKRMRVFELVTNGHKYEYAEPGL